MGPLRLLTVDTIITGLIDVMLSFPAFFLILTVVAILKPSIWNIMIVIGLTSWEGPARFVRAEILSLREQEFIHAAQGGGRAGLAGHRPPLAARTPWRPSWSRRRSASPARS